MGRQRTQAGRKSLLRVRGRGHDHAGMTATLGGMSVQEFERYAATHDRCELVAGEVRELPAGGYRHGVITQRLNYWIARSVFAHDLGEVFGMATGFRLDDAEGPSVRSPDVAFLAKDRAASVDREYIKPIAPDLVVETVGPEDHPADVAARVAWWLGHGAAHVWVADFEARTVTTTAGRDGEPRVYAGGDTLTAEGLLPGFAVAIAKLYAR